MASAGIYVHIPFCMAKCAYCDFASFPGRESLYDAYVEAVLHQVRAVASHWTEADFDTLYVGGGTPTVLAPQQLQAVLLACRQYLGLLPGAETTCEANPGTVDLASLALLRAAGYGRLSLGGQSLDDEELALLGRIHDREAVLQAYADARTAGFDNISLDLIYGIPYQALDDWRQSLEQAIALNPEHLSLYALSVEPGTPLSARVACGALPGPDDDMLADMYALAQETLAQSGYVQYEISSWARASGNDPADGAPVLASQHNLHYWHGDRYLGLGAAAHSFDGSTRYAQYPEPEAFIERVALGQDTVQMRETQSPDEQMDEAMMLGLRVAEGVSWARFRERFGVDARDVYAETLETVRDMGLVDIDDRGIRLRPEAYILGNRVFVEFLR